MTKCPRCGKHEAIVDRTYGILPCEKCQEDDEKIHLRDEPEFYTLTRANRIIEQRDKHSKDLVQPFKSKGKPNEEFLKAYPDKVGDYFSKEDLKGL